MDEAGAVLDVTKETTPAGLALLNIVIAAAIPATWAVTWWLHRLKPRWLSSVTPRLRWRYLLVCLALSVVALLASLGVGLLLPLAPGESPIGDANEFTARTRDFMLVILLLTPLQAAGEEYLFRGYLTQAFGSLVWSRRLSQALAVLVPALIFALFHGISQDAPVFFDRFAFGVVAGILVIRTGGLEAAIAMHVLNNFLAFGLALAFGDLTTVLTATGGSSWWMILSTLTQSLVYLALATWVAKAMGLVNVGPPVGGALPPGSPDPVLEGSPPRV
jgi:membrane protease YdiL (CAAX protease family)